MAKKVTIYEVAEAAGVSISTVSLVLKSSPRISAGTSKRVLDVIDRLGYVPKSDAVSRARRSAGRIGVIAPFSSYSYFGRQLNGVMSAVRDRGVEVVVFDHASAATEPSPALAALPVSERLDGLLVMALPLDDTIAQRITDRQLATVLVGEPDGHFDSVHSNDHAGGAKAAESLLSKGHSALAFLGEEQRSDAYVLPSKRRLQGFQETVASAGSSLPEQNVIAVENTPAAALRSAKELLQRADRPTGVFAAHDLLAAAVLRAARHLQLRVPEEVAVIGYDDSELAEVLDLTSVRAPAEEVGSIAATMLMDRISAPSRPIQHVAVSPELIDRLTV